MNCKDKLDINKLVEEEISNQKGNIRNALGQIIGKPFSHVPFLQERLNKLTPKINKNIKDKNEIRRIKSLIIDEKKRHKAHTNLFHYLTNTLDRFATESKHSIPVDVIVGLVSVAGRDEFGDLFNMPDTWFFNPKTFNTKTSKFFDYRRTIAVHNFFKRYFDVPIPKTMSKWDDQIKQPAKTVLARDRTGYAVKAVDKSKSLFDDKLRMAHKYKEWNDKIINAFNQHVGVKESDEAHEFLQKVGHSINRYIIPMNETPTGEFEKYYNSQVELESGKHKIQDKDGKRNDYVLVSVPPEALIDFREERKDISIKAEIWFAYKVNDFKNNNIKEGWYDAVSDKQIVGEKIKGTYRDKKVLKDFNYLEKQPNENWFGDTEPGAMNLWEALFNFRSLLESHKINLQKRNENINNQIKIVNDKIKKRIEISGNQSIKDLFDRVPNSGGETSFLFPNPVTGDLEVPGVYMREANNQFYFPSMYEHWVHVEMLEDAIKKINLNINIINAKTIANKKILSDKKASKEKKNKARREIVAAHKQIENMTGAVDTFQKKIDMVSDVPGVPDIDRKELNRIYSGVHSKHRVYFTNRLKGRFDKEVIEDYIYKSYQSVVSNEMRLAMLETILHTDAVTAEFVVDQGSVVMGDVRTRAGFGLIKYDNVTMAKLVANHYHGSDIKITPELIHQQIIFNTSLFAGINYGMPTSFTNNFQRLNRVIKFGFMFAVEVDKIKREGDGVYTAEQFEEFARYSGVLEPTFFLADILSIGAGGTELFGFLPPIRDLNRLRKSKKDFVKGTDFFDKMLKTSTLRQKNRLLALKGIRKEVKLTMDELTEIKQRKGNFYDLIHTKETNVKKLKAMAKKLQLFERDSHLKKFVRWKLEYPLFGLKALTMIGTEQNMRTEDFITGYLLAKKRGMLDETDTRLPLPKQDNSVAMGRLTAYQNSFGMSSQFIAKMFRGFGKIWWQPKQYQWHQSVHDWKIVREFSDSQEYKNILASGTEGMYRLTKEAARMTGRPITGQRTKDIPANKMIKFLATRGLTSLMSLGMFGFVPLIGDAASLVTRTITGGQFGGRAVRGTTTPLLMYPLRALLLAYTIAVRYTDDKDELDKGLTEFLMDWFPPYLNALLNLFLDPENAPRPLVPFYSPTKDAIKTTLKAIEKIE